MTVGNSLSLRAEQNVPSVRRRNYRVVSEVPRRCRGTNRIKTNCAQWSMPCKSGLRLIWILHSEYTNAFMHLASTINGHGFGDKFSSAPWTLHQLLVWFVLAWGPRHSGISSEVLQDVTREHQSWPPHHVVDAADFRKLLCKTC